MVAAAVEAAEVALHHQWVACRLPGACRQCTLRRLLAACLLPATRTALQWASVAIRACTPAVHQAATTRTLPITNRQGCILQAAFPQEAHLLECLPDTQATPMAASVLQAAIRPPVVPLAVPLVRSPLSLTGGKRTTGLPRPP